MWAGVFDDLHGTVNTEAHNMSEATCTAPKTCTLCGETEGTALDHDWAAADCDTPKTCTVCSTATGAPLGHSWVGANCDTPKTCSVCKASEGSAIGHRYTNDCDADCNTCDAERTPAQHVDGNGDLVCDVCNARLADGTEHDGLSGGAIVGIVVGAIAVAGGIGALVYLLLKKKKKADGADEKAS